MAHWNPRSFFRVNGGLTSLLTRASGCGSWCLSLWSQVWAWLGSQRNWRRSSQRTWLLPWQTWLHRALVTVYITNLRNFLNKNDCYFMWTSPILNKFLLSKHMQGHMRRLSEKQLSQAGPVQSPPPPPASAFVLPGLQVIALTANVHIFFRALLRNHLPWLLCLNVHIFIN